MKKWILFLLFCLIIYTSYLDLSQGTLSSHDATNDVVKNEQPHLEVVVQHGETVLSVLERMHGTLPVSIDKALQDFIELNPKVDPIAIEAGKKYKFPVYDEE